MSNTCPQTWRQFVEKYRRGDMISVAGVKMMVSHYFPYVEASWEKSSCVSFAYNCSNCGFTLTEEMRKAIGDYPEYCPGCGQHTLLVEEDD